MPAQLQCQSIIDRVALELHSHPFLVVRAVAPCGTQKTASCSDNVAARCCLLHPFLFLLLSGWKKDIYIRGRPALCLKKHNSNSSATRERSSTSCRFRTAPCGMPAQLECQSIIDWFALELHRHPFLVVRAVAPCGT